MDWAVRRSVRTFADVAELVDAPDLGSGAARREGSSPFIRTITFVHVNNNNESDALVRGVFGCLLEPSAAALVLGLAFLWTVIRWV